MRIAIIAYIDIGYGMGATRRVTMLAQGLRDCGNDVHLLGATWGSCDRATAGLEGVHVHDFGMSLGGRAIPRAGLRRVRALQTLIALSRDRLDWVILYNLGIDALPFFFVAKRTACRVATDNCDLRRGSEVGWFRRLVTHTSYRLADRLLRPMADINIVVSSYLERCVLQDAPLKPVHVLPALIDTTAFVGDANAAVAFRAQWSLGKGRLIGYLGSTRHFEGLCTLLRAAKLLTQRGLAFRLLVAGDMIRSDLHDDLPVLVQQLGLSEHVVLVGRLGTQELLGALSAADVLVVPKSDDLANVAGFPQKLTEYLSVGKPVVATRVGDVPRYLRHGEDSLLCRPDDEVSLANALAAVIRDPDLRTSLGKAARRTAIRHFDQLTQCEALQSVLLSCSGPGPGEAPS